MQVNPIDLLTAFKKHGAEEIFIRVPDDNVVNDARHRQIRCVDGQGPEYPRAAAMFDKHVHHPDRTRSTGKSHFIVRAGKRSFCLPANIHGNKFDLCVANLHQKCLLHLGLQAECADRCVAKVVLEGTKCLHVQAFGASTTPERKAYSMPDAISSGFFGRNTMEPVRAAQSSPRSVVTTN